MNDDDLYVTWPQLAALCIGILIGTAIVVTAAWFAAKWFT